MYGRAEGPWREPLGDAEIQRLADRAEQGYAPHELRPRNINDDEIRQLGDELRFRNVGDEIRRERRAEVASLIQEARRQLGDAEADRMLADLDGDRDAD